LFCRVRFQEKVGTIGLIIKLNSLLKMLKSAACHKSKKNLLFSLQRLSLILGLAAAGSLARALPVLATPDIAIGGTQIDNQATASYVDGDIPGAATETTVSNIVTVKVAEVAGISITEQVPTDAPGNAASYPNDASGTTQLVPGPYQGFAGIHLGDIVYFDFVINNIGNDPTQFVIPNTATVINGTVGQLQIIEYGGVALTSPVNVPTAFDLDTNSTGTLLNGVSGTNNGSVPANGSIKVRVPVIVTSGTGTVSARLGDTSPAVINPAANQPRQITGSTDIYTRDNLDPTPALPAAAGNEVIGTPANGEREASAIASIAILGQNVSGSVFEDANYGGGSGRSKTLSSGTNVANATVELYDSVGKFVRSTTTDTSGDYTFPAVPVGDFYVRVVNNTIKSNRPGGAAATDLLPVQTFLTDAGVTAGTVSSVIDRVGGETPRQSDTGAGAVGAVFSLTTKQFTTAAGTAAVSGYIQSLTKVKAGTVVVSGVDFGYNFDTIVNTNDSGQGSLRQFVANSNTLTNAGLAQVNQTAGKEVSIFMIPDGNAHAGLQATVPSQLTSNRALISLISPLQITDANTSIDGRTQTNNINNSNALTLGTGGTVGVGSLVLASLSAPEVEITNSGAVANGIEVNGANAIVRNIAIHGFGTAGSNQGDILLRGANPIVTENAIGTTALSFAAPTNNQSQSGIVINGALAANISNNLIGFTNERGILGGNSATATDLTGLVISGNEIRKTGNGTGTTDQHGGIELFASTAGNVSILGNLITEAGTDSGIEINAGGTGIATSFLIQNNSLPSNGSGSSGFGIVLQGNGTNNIDGIKIDKNILNANRNGITSRQNNVTISENLVSNSVGAYGIGIENGKQGNKITQNSIYGNVGPGIDIATTTTANGVTANNGVTGSTLSNNGIDYPLITATSFGTTLDVKGYVGISPAGNATFAGVTLEFFLADNSPNDQNGEVIAGDGKLKPHGEGKTYLGTCTADSLGRFGTTGNLCTLTNATLSSSNFNNITATATDSSGNTSEFSAIPSTRAKLLLAKRITSITDGTTGSVTSFSNYVADSTNTATDWPNINTEVIGAIDGGQAKPGDIVEYAVYYRNAGENRISSAKVCDRLNTNLVYQTNFDASHVGSGIVLKLGSSAEQFLTSTSDTDQGEFATTQPTDCNLVGSAINATSNNVVVVQAANSTTSIPGLSNGYIKFKAKVQE
jgi:uncharacterized repeat protein (TIGR01451 family)